MPRVRIVLVRPEGPANVGASARLVRNAGLAGLDLVAPGDWRTVECWRTAWGAQDVLEQARVFPDLGGAVGDSALAVALSSRGERKAPVLDVREAAARVAALGEGAVASLVFGPETSGLTADELARCGQRATIPTHPHQPALNLSHAVAIVAYEVFRAGRLPSSHPRLATHELKEAMLGLLCEGLQAVEALPKVNVERYFREWRALFARAELTPKDVRLLEHMARKMVRTRVGRVPAGHLHSRE
ncbi:MAG TPA: TrmH family RNA methyltransferase [Vicinamibacteria bacterium]|nr:TrmH family RNA methyltransferase [Vicinamibacteria bacterium]